MGFTEDAIDVLRGKGCRITAPRRAILELLENTTQPLSAPELHKQLKAVMKSKPVDRISVYRNLVMLEQAGLVHRVPPKGDFLVCTHHHCGYRYHVLMRCEFCQKVEEVGVPENLLKPLYSHIRRKHWLMPEEHLLQVAGSCESCAQKSSEIK